MQSDKPVDPIVSEVQKAKAMAEALADTKVSDKDL